MQTPISAVKSTQSPIYKVSNSIDLNLNIEDFRQQVLDPDKARSMAEFFCLLSDANNLQILSLLAKRDLCVNDLVNILETNESDTIAQLETLRTLGLVDLSKRGGKIYYRLSNRHVLNLYKSAVEHLNKIES